MTWHLNLTLHQDVLLLALLETTILLPDLLLMISTLLLYQPLHIQVITFLRARVYLALLLPIAMIWERMQAPRLYLVIIILLAWGRLGHHLTMFTVLQGLVLTRHRSLATITPRLKNFRGHHFLSLVTTTPLAAA